MRASLSTSVFLGSLLIACRVDAQITSPGPANAGSAQSIDEIRENYALRAGPLYVDPVVMLRELGVDTNVFNQPDAQSDFTMALSPQAKTALPVGRRALFTVTLGTDLVYFAHFTSERSVDPLVIARGEFYARRLTFFVEEAYLNTRQRPSYDIDLRARHLENNLSAGAGVRLSTATSVNFAARRSKTRFDGDASFYGQSLPETLDRDSNAYSVVGRYKHSNLTTLGLLFEDQTDRFVLSPIRNTDSFRIMPGVELRPRALISGSAWVGYRSFNPRSPLIPRQSGLVSRLALSYTLFGATTFGVIYDRDYDYAFESATPYYINNGVNVSVRRAIGRQFDVIANVARYRYDYKRLALDLPVPDLEDASLPDRRDVTDNVGVNFGYRLKRQTRVGLGISYWTRSSNLRSFRDYDDLRIGLTMAYEL